MKAGIKRLIGRTLYPLIGNTARAVAVLNFHSVGGSARGSQSTASFREQVGWLSRHAATFPVLSLREAFSDAETEGCTPVLFTFDDGYRDNAEIAAPTLEEFGYRAIFFVSTAFISGDRGIVARFRNYAGLPNMTWDQLGQLSERGHEIGLHGHVHPNYARLSFEEAREDIERSLECIRSQIGVMPTRFAYPFGQPHHTRSDLEPIFERLRIEHAFTTLHKRADARALENQEGLRFAIPRLRVDPADSTKIFVEKLQGIWDWVALVQSARSRWWSGTENAS